MGPIPGPELPDVGSEALEKLREAGERADRVAAREAASERRLDAYHAARESALTALQSFVNEAVAVAKGLRAPAEALVKGALEELGREALKAGLEALEDVGG